MLLDPICFHIYEIKSIQSQIRDFWYTRVFGPSFWSTQSRQIVTNYTFGSQRCFCFWIVLSSEIFQCKIFVHKFRSYIWYLLFVCLNFIKSIGNKIMHTKLVSLMVITHDHVSQVYIVLYVELLRLCRTLIKSLC